MGENEKIKLKNGNTIEIINTPNNNSRGKRAELVSFYCSWCKCIHIDYPIKDLLILHRDIYCSKILEE